MISFVEALSKATRVAISFGGGFYLIEVNRSVYGFTNKGYLFHAYKGKWDVLVKGCTEISKEDLILRSI